MSSRRARKRGVTIAWPGAAVLSRAAIAVAIVLLVAWLTIGTSLGARVGTISSALILRWQPWNAAALGASASDRLTARLTDRAGIRQASAQARQSLARDPTSAAAWRTLGLTTEFSGDPRAASKIMRFASQVSRRDLATQLWLIEERVKADDVAGALQHYDIAMRTKPDSQNLLLPVLAIAADDPALMQPIAKLLASAPPWTEAFYYRLNQTLPAPGRVAGLLSEVRRAGGSLDSPTIPTLVANLIARDRLVEARNVVSLRLNDPALGRRVRDGRFDRTGAEQPFDWQVEAKSDFGGEVRERPAAKGNPSLALYAVSGARGVAARQLLTLPPGGYRLAWTAGTAEQAPARLVWRVRCGRTETALIEAAVPLTGQAGRSAAAAFQLPANCPAQWLELHVDGGSSPQGATAWVDDVRVEPAR